MAQSNSTVEWELYNLENDPSEQTDLAAKEPEKLKELILHWDQYAKDNRIVLPEWKSGE
jgi:arylsulfatase